MVMKNIWYLIMLLSVVVVYPYVSYLLWMDQLRFMERSLITFILAMAMFEGIHQVIKKWMKINKKPKYHRGTFLTKPRKISHDAGDVISSPHMWQYENGVYITSLLGMINGLTGRFGYYLVADEVNQETKQFEGYKWIRADK